MFGALVSGSSGCGQLWRGALSVFLSKTLCSHSASLHQGLQMGTGKLNVTSTLAVDYYPIQGGGKNTPS